MEWFTDNTAVDGKLSSRFNTAMTALEQSLGKWNVSLDPVSKTQMTSAWRIPCDPQLAADNQEVTQYPVGTSLFPAIPGQISQVLVAPSAQWHTQSVGILPE